jgi:hypothetical protein
MYEVFEDLESAMVNAAYELAWMSCPLCAGLMVWLRTGRVGLCEEELVRVDTETLLYPQGATRAVDSSVPERYRTAFLEACSVLPYSRRASAAIGRQVLLTLLRDELGASRHDLAGAINETVSRSVLPAHINEAWAGVRQKAGLPGQMVKNMAPATITDAAPGEPELLIEVIDVLLDSLFTLQRRLNQQRDTLRRRLNANSVPTALLGGLRQRSGRP